MPTFRPRGRLFSYLSVAIKHFFSKWAFRRERLDRKIPTEEKILIELAENRFGPELPKILSLDIRRLYTTRFTKPKEREAQRYLLDGLVATGN